MPSKNIERFFFKTELVKGRLSYSTSHNLSKETRGNAINQPQSPIPKAYKLFLQHLRDWMDPAICNGIPGPLFEK